MKLSTITFLIACLILLISSTSFSQQADSAKGYIIRHESDLLKAMKSPHNGTGNVKGGDFFGINDSLNLVLRERRLQNGGSLGKHEQKKDEIYFVVSGEGTIYLNDIPYKIKPGDAVLTRKGSTHAVEQTSKEDLVILVIFGS